MSITYAGMKAAVQAYLQNTGEEAFIGQMDRFIRIAEERILKNVQLTIFRKNATSAFSVGSPYLTLPSDYLTPYSLSYTDSSGAKQFLLLKDVSFIQEFHPDPSVTSPPRYYAHFDEDNYIVAPTPASELPVELHYFYRPPSLSDGEEDGTTWLSRNAENTLLKGAIYEGYFFLKGDPELLAMYEKAFTEGIISLKSFGESKELRDAYRTGMVIRDRT